MTALADLAQLLKTRRTIGTFVNEPIDDQCVLTAIELACWAPNHRKTEPWRFTLLGPETRQAILDLNYRNMAAKKGPDVAEEKRRQWAQIPGWLVVTCLRSADAFLAEEDYAATCCAVQNLLLSLWSQGIGTKWSTGDITRHEEYLPLLGIDPAKERTVGLIWYGRPQSLPEQTRKPASEVTRIRP